MQTFVRKMKIKIKKNEKKISNEAMKLSMH